MYPASEEEKECGGDGDLDPRERREKEESRPQRFVAHDESGPCLTSGLIFTLVRRYSIFRLADLSCLHCEN